jgi:hypothetical protein
MFEDLSSSARRAAGGLGRRARGWPRLVQVGLAGGLAITVLAVVGLAAGWFNGGHQPTGRPPATRQSANTPLIRNPVMYQDQRGFSVNVPGSWKERRATTYVDFTDPQDPGRRVRVNVEPAGGTAQQFLLAVERQFKNDHNKCPQPFKELGLHTASLAGRPAAELEFTCGSGGQMKHFLWRATVTGKKAYEFYLSVEDGRFQESTVIYQEMVRSYQLSAG